MRKDEKEYLDINFLAIRAEMKSDRDMQTYKFDELLKHQEKQNGRTSVLEKETYFFRLVHRHPRISIITALVLAAVFTFSTVYISHNVNVKKTIENKTGIVIDE